MESVLEHLLKHMNHISISHHPIKWHTYIQTITTNSHEICSNKQHNQQADMQLVSATALAPLSSAYQLCHPDWLHFGTRLEVTFLPPNRSMFCQWHFWLHRGSKCEDQLHRHWNNYFSEDILLNWKWIILTCFIEKRFHLIQHLTSFHST